MRVYDACVGHRYRVRVEPASAISSTPRPRSRRPRTSPKCLGARREVRIFREKTKVTARKLRRARKRSAKRRYRAQLKRQKRALTRALDRQAINC